ncbi:MAG: metallophosphoesterase [Hyphomicrobiaceae bacterium]
MNRPNDVTPGSRRTYRIAQISDSHLSETHAYFVDNFRVLAEEIKQTAPDLVVHSGDISFNGPVAEADLAFSRREMERISARWRIIPGNHDVGEAPHHSRLEQPLTDARLEAWKGVFGPLWWTEDIGEWRLVGLDTSLFDSGRGEESEQAAFLVEALGTRGERPVLLFMHMPPFVDDPEDPRPTTSAIPFEARQAFLETCRRGGVRVIACGHLHVYRRMTWQGIEIVWAPCTSFVNIEKWLKHFGGFARSGYIEWTLDGPNVAHRLVEPPRLFTHDTGLWSNLYGTVTKLPPRPLG